MHESVRMNPQRKQHSTEAIFVFEQEHIGANTLTNRNIEVYTLHVKVAMFIISIQLCMSSIPCLVSHVINECFTGI